MKLIPLVDMTSAYALYLIAGAIAAALLWLLRTPPTEAGEPPLKRPLIPGIGHGIGMFWYGSKYLEMLRTKYQLPIFMIPVLRGKIVIIVSPDLVQSAIRAKDLSFDLLGLLVARNLLGAKGPKFEEASVRPENDKEVHYIGEMHQVYHETLAPGPDLQQANINMLKRLSVFINEVGPEYTRRDLYEWIRTTLTISTATSLYGARNPFVKDHSLIAALLDFDANVQNLMTGFLPSITARKGYKARAKIQAAMREYFQAGYFNDDDVSVFIKRREALNRKYGFTPEDCGDFDLGMIFVSTTNAVPTLYWFMIYAFSQPAVIASIRDEVRSIIKSSTDSSGTKTMTLDISKINDFCPLLVSAYQETQRLCNKVISIRIAVRDTTLFSATEGSYLIKKHTTVFSPAALHTTAAEVWGPDAESFVATRFLTRDKDKEKIQKKTFFPFGGGRHYCPGRHFAFAEILGVIAVMCTGFNIAMADGPDGGPGGPIRVPGRRERHFAETIPKPAEMVEVFIRRREGFEDVKWGFGVGEVEV